MRLSHACLRRTRARLRADATLRPPEASVSDYRKLQHRLGTTRTVVVTPSTYGIDNRVMLRALEELGASARGVAVVDASVSDHELQMLDRRGVRGIRFNLSLSQVATIDMLEQLAQRVAELGWHVQLLMPPAQLVDIEALLVRTARHVGVRSLRTHPFAEGAKHPAFGVIARLVERGRAWVKLSAAYLHSIAGPPTYSDAAPLARAFVALAPDRVLWGSDWPHVVAKDGVPDDAQLFDLLIDWAPDDTTRNKILVHNPAKLYGY